MLTKRIIPCLDIKNGRTVKGTNFINLKDAGDPIALASLYSNVGADELVFLDISATTEERSTLTNLVSQIASKINIPFTVGGGIASLDDIARLLDNGADKISINSAAVHNPKLVSKAAAQFGSQCVVIAMDVKCINGKHFVHTHGGKKATELEALTWAQQMAAEGAGEILLTSMDADGTKNGYALAITKAISDAITIPVIASGGAGKIQHFIDVFKIANADAALAASIFHFNEIQISTLKQALALQNIPVRL
jgi:imidazole glycerol-phosphate synthase subunit HisF